MSEFRDMDIGALVNRAVEFNQIKNGNEMAGVIESGAHRGEIG